MRSPLTPKQKRVFDNIRAYAKAKGYMPSVRDLMDVTGSALGTVHEHLKALERKGWIVVDGTSRGIYLFSDAPSQPDGVDVPIAGTLSAGSPIETGASPRETVRLPRSLAAPGSYALRVRGDGMAGEHMLDGDLVIIAPKARVRNGDITLVLREDGTAALQRVHRGRDHARSSSASARESGGLHVQGKLTALVRLFRP